MSAHLRSKIRARAADQISGLPSSADRVFVGRTRSLADTHAPTWLVYARNESSDVDSVGPSKLLRTLSLALEGRVTAGGDDAAAAVELQLDTMAAEAEVAMAADFSLGGLAVEVTLTGTQVEVIAPGERHQGRIVLNYRIAYRTLESDPTASV